MEYNQTSDRRIFVIDNGGHTIKLGFNFQSSPRVIPNCIHKGKQIRNRLFVANQVDECGDKYGLYYLMPTEKGYITRWEYQKLIWDHMLGKDYYNVDLTETCIVLTEPIFNFGCIRDATDEIFFEEYGVGSLFKANPTDFVAYVYLNFGLESVKHETYGCCFVMDSGFSFSHAIPYIGRRKYWNGIGRIDVGGKLLTNHLKEIISYRQLHVMDETYIMNQVKEDACFVSLDFEKDMRIASDTNTTSTTNTVIREYVLPDFNTLQRGSLRNVQNDKEPIINSSAKQHGHHLHHQQLQNHTQNRHKNLQKLILNNERFTVPEILFRPTDIEINQLGVATSTSDRIINCCPEQYRPWLTKNVIITGGNCKFPGFGRRFFNELRENVTDAWDVNVHALSEDPVTDVWKCAAKMSQDENFGKFCASRYEYEEFGGEYIKRRFESVVLDHPLQTIY